MSKIDELRQDRANVNQHSERGATLTRKSIAQFGARLAGVVDKNGIIIDGNDRQRAYQELQIEDVEIIEADPQKPIYLRFNDLDLSDPNNPARELQIALHRSAAESWTVDAEALLAHIQSGVGVDAWFDQSELDALLEDLTPPKTGAGAAPEIDRAEELRKKWAVESGQVWQLGDHRLIVGDCTDRAVVARLMGTERADAIITDPPYCSGGFQEAGKKSGSIGTRGDEMIANDTLSTRGYMALMKSVLMLAQCGVAYIFTDWRMWINLFDVVESSGYGVRQMIVWDKGSPGMGRGWRSQHELIMASMKVSQPFDPKKAQGNVIQCTRTGNVNHPTEKPVELIETLLDVTDMARIIYEPFCGSGTILIACERLGRKCRAIEIAPGYAAVTIERWHQETGRDPEQITL